MLDPLLLLLVDDGVLGVQRPQLLDGADARRVVRRHLFALQALAQDPRAHPQPRGIVSCEEDAGLRLGVC